MVNGANSFLSETGTFRDGKNVKKESNATIAAFYTMLRRYFPSFEVTSQKEFSFRNLIFSYFTSDVITASTGVKVDPKDGKTPTLENETDVVIAKNFTMMKNYCLKILVPVSTKMEIVQGSPITQHCYSIPGL